MKIKRNSEFMFTPSRIRADSGACVLSASALNCQPAYSQEPHVTVTKDTPLGFIGLGVMGAAMAKNLLKAGFRVTVHNRSRGKVDELLASGARDGGSPAGVARATEVVLLCVPD